MVFQKQGQPLLKERQCSTDATSSLRSAQPTLTVRVARKSVETADICSFELVSANGSKLPEFSAGSHIDVYLSNGITRQYSLYNSPQENHRYLIGILKDPATRGGSRTMHEQVNEGDMLHISSPKNHFPLVHGAQNTILLAGGIGVTPILCMAERLAIDDSTFEMHYCTRSQNRAAFLDRILQSTFTNKLNLHFDDGAPQQKLDIPSLLDTAMPTTHIYVCGPKGFMDAVLNTAHAKGWPASQLHYEFFSAQIDASGTDESFEIQLARSSKLFIVPKGKTVVEVLAAASIDIPTSCEQGVCGTCLTRVLDGEPDHRDMYLTTEEKAANNQFLPCCSRAKSTKLVLDL